MMVEKRGPVKPLGTIAAKSPERRISRCGRPDPAETAPSSLLQESRNRRIHRRQAAASATAMADSSAVSSHWNSQNLLAGW